MEKDMARIRNIKPEFFIDPELQDLEAANPGKYVMMVYEGLWTQSSKNGVFLWEPRILKLYILPFLSYDIADTMDILYKAGFIKRFQHDGKKYGYTPTFHKHQTISGQEVKRPSKYPDYIEGSDWEVINDCPLPIEGSDWEGKGQADLGLRTQDIGLRTTDVNSTLPQAATLKPFEVTIPDKTNTLYNEIKTAFEKVNGDFTNYAKEGTAIKRIIKMTKGDQNAIRVMIRTFFTLRQRNDKYWSAMPFTPSRLAASGVWDGVKEEAKKTLKAADTSWIDAMEKEEAMV